MRTYVLFDSLLQSLACIYTRLDWMRDSQSLTLISLSRMDIINDFTQDEVSFLLDIVHEYYAKDDSVEPLIEKLWKLDRLLQIEDIRTDKAWRQS